MVGENKNLIFHQHFLNMDILLTIPHTPFKFEIFMNEIYVNLESIGHHRSVVGMSQRTQVV